MAIWDYDVEVSGVNLADFCDRVVVVTEAMGSKEDTDIKVPGIEGVLHIPGKLWDSGNVILSTWLKYASATGTITHVDGPAGHVYENFSALKQLLRTGPTQVVLKRILPDAGIQQIEIESIDAPNIGDAHFHYLWTLKAAKPFWHGTSAVVVSGSGAHNPAGDGVVDDMVLDFDSAGFIDIDGERVSIVGSSGGNIIVNVGTRTVLQSGVPRDSWLRVASENWLRLRGGISSTVTISGSVSMSYFPKWQ